MKLWAAYAVSAYGSGLGFGALPLLAVLVVDAGPAQVAALAAVGPAVGALLALPLAPWIEGRRKRPVMIAADLVRGAATASVPAAYLLGVLGIAQLAVVSATVAAAKIASSAAMGAYLKDQVPDLLRVNARFESTTWSSLAVGPPLGGAAIGLFGPVTTVLADAASYLGSALLLSRIRDREGPRARRRVRVADLLDGARHLLTHPGLRGLLLNQLAVSGLILATEPLLAVLLLRELDYPPWWYGLAFAAPCVGGLVGSRLARRVVARFGVVRVLRGAGVLRVLPLPALALVPPGVGGLATVMVVEFAVIAAMSLYTPVQATYRLERTPPVLVARTLTAWSVASGLAVAGLSALGGLLAQAVGTRTAIAVAGLLALASPLLLPGPRALDAVAAPSQPEGGASPG